MEWDWKEFAWDSAELEVSSDGLGLGEHNKEGASVNLKLVENCYLAEKSGSDSAAKDPGELKTASSPSGSGSAKRIRMNNGSLNTTCSVDGCNSDLSNCRDYHRRHRVCEKHSKTPVVLVGGKQQRFCQQCSRFHSLGEFDEVKRSCRKRLDGHNRRRRKPQPPSLFMAAEKFLTNYKGPRILHFGSPQTCAYPIMRNMWPVTAKIGVDSISYDRRQPLHRIDQQGLMHSFTSVTYGQDMQLPIFHGNDPIAGFSNEAVPVISINKPISGAIAPSASGKGTQKLCSDGKPRSFDSGCALYLLSTPQAQSSGLSLVQSSISCPVQSPLRDEHFDAVDKYSFSESARDKPTDPVLFLEANTNNLHCNGLLRDGSLGNGESVTLPFFWE
ncbi:hypothetical protein L6164_009063 [Bauhinia variegata]|uniref:Uncharacterized protein n=1 Tax=Bauhinia variegata TaxID=167791 RepID=A0ACB9PIF7_BAUVA|nr:hypothetical protein L6164_009063 [Bauhinia variegata]